MIYEEELSLDYKTNRHFLFTSLVLFYLKAVVAMTTTPSSGRVWNLVSDNNAKYTIEASFRLLAIPIASWLCVKDFGRRNVVLIFG